MIEILFKAKRVDGKGWLESKNITRLIHENVVRVFFTESFWFDEKFGISNCQYIEVIPETVCQFTGLLDRNGVKIFEGDNIIHSSKSNIKGVVSFFEGSFIVGVAITSNALINFNAPKNLHVIGNIHD